MGAYLCDGIVKSGAQSAEMEDALLEIATNSSAETWSPDETGDFFDVEDTNGTIPRSISCPL